MGLEGSTYEWMSHMISPKVLNGVGMRSDEEINVYIKYLNYTLCGGYDTQQNMWMRDCVNGKILPM